MKQEYKNVLTKATKVLSDELDPDHEFRPLLCTILSPQQRTNVYVTIIFSIFNYYYYYLLYGQD